jgi:hypothetical protein
VSEVNAVRLCGARADLIEIAGKRLVEGSLLRWENGGQRIAAVIEAFFAGAIFV